MVFGKLLGQSSQRASVPRSLDEFEATAHIERLELAFFQISSIFTANKDLSTILEYFIKESLNCLGAHRSTYFLHFPEMGGLKVQFTHVLDPGYEQIGRLEEKEVAKKALREGKPLLLAGPGSFSNFFRYEERENKITSIICVPLFIRGKAMGVLSSLLINGRYNFDEKSLRLFSSFSNLASAAIELVQLQDEAKRGNDFRITYERYLDNILAQLQSLSDREQQRIQNHISVIQAEEKAENQEFLERKTDERVPWTQGAILLKDEPGVERRSDERIEILVRVEFDEEYCCFTGDLSGGGTFILTQNPMDLEDEFTLKIHIPDGREPVEVGCRVVWTNKYGKESKGLRRGMGVKFVKLKPGDQTRIEEFIEAYMPKGSS
jgi:uncharacterized protein (TIGR02266 family)